MKQYVKSLINKFSILCAVVCVSSSSLAMHLSRIDTIGDVKEAIESKVFSSPFLSLKFQEGKIWVLYQGETLRGNFTLTNNLFIIDESPESVASTEVTVAIDTLSDLQANLDPVAKVDLTDRFPIIVLTQDRSKIEKIVWETHYTRQRFELYPAE